MGNIFPKLMHDCVSNQSETKDENKKEEDSSVIIVYNYNNQCV